MTSQQIEAAAIAIQQRHANRSGRGRPWTAIPARLQEQYREEARAALVAAHVGDDWE